MEKNHNNGNSLLKTKIIPYFYASAKTILIDGFVQNVNHFDYETWHVPTT